MAGPKYLLVGNLTIDVTLEGKKRGGAVWVGAHGAGDVLASAFCCFILMGSDLIESAQEVVALATRIVVDGLPALARRKRELVR